MQKLPKGLLLGFLAVMLASIPAMAEGVIVNPTKLSEEFWQDVLGDLLLIGVPFLLAAIYMLVRYTAKSPGQVGDPVKLGVAAQWAWVLIPVSLFLTDDLLLFGKGWTLWSAWRVVPQNAVEVKVTGHQWFFEFDYGNGVTDQDLVVEVGKPVVLRLTSEDVIHSFGLTDYRVKEDLVPGRINYLWFYPDAPKETFVNCMEYCGTGHAQMHASVRALPKAEYDQWLGKHKSAAAGALKFASQSLDGTASK
jgi:cytochrome c oxidase subunit II